MNNNGTRISIFNPAAYAMSQALPEQNIQRISDGLLFCVSEERNASASLMANVEQSLVAKVLTDQGFEIHVKGVLAGANVGITDPAENPYLMNLWLEELSKALVHGCYYGYAAISIRTIYEPGTDPIEKLREELEKETRSTTTSARVKTEYNKDMTQEDENVAFLEEEYERLMQKEKPTAPPDFDNPKTKSYRVPRTMNPLTEYWVGKRTHADGSVRYDAFLREKVNTNVPIPDSFVFIFREPDEFNMPRSMFLDCLADIQVLRAMLGRYQLREYNLTNPVNFFQAKQQASQSIIPNETHIAYSTTGAEEPGDGVGTMVRRTTGWTGDKTLEENTLEKRKQILAEANRYMSDAIRISMADVKEPGTQLKLPKYHKQLGHLSYLKKINPFEPYFIIPDQMELSPNVPKAVQPGDWTFVIRLLQTNIANACSVMPQVLTGERAVVGADVELNREDNNSRIRLLQRQMERLIGTTYVQAFAPLHKLQIRYSIAEVKFQRRLRLLAEADTRERLRQQLRQRYETLTRAMEATLEENARSEMFDLRTEVQQQLSLLPEFDPKAASFEWDLDSTQSDLGNHTTEYWQIVIEAKLQVVVHVFENPSLTFDELQKLMQARCLDELMFRKLALRTYGLPEEYISKLPLGELTQITNPKAENGSGASKPAKKKTDDKKRTAGQDKAAKKQKTSE